MRKRRWRSCDRCGCCNDCHSTRRARLFVAVAQIAWVATQVWQLVNPLMQV